MLLFVDENNKCRARGGAFHDTGSSLRCATDLSYSRNHANHGTGLRCCSP